MNVVIIDEFTGNTLRTQTVANESEYEELARSLDVMQAAILI
ncbi:hypothetical protein [Niallia circulans]|nr:hypothetical protein [Niallia circulans]